MEEHMDPYPGLYAITVTRDYNSENAVLSKEALKDLGVKHCVSAYVSVVVLCL